MTRRKFQGEIKIPQYSCLKAIEITEKMLCAERELLEQLYEIEKNKFYILLGYRSLRGFCEHHLRITRTQSQRIVTLLRRKIYYE